MIALLEASPVYLAVGVTLAFTLLARWLRGVNFSGAVAGAVICFVMYLTAGPAAVASLALVFALTWTSTRFGYSRKRRMGTAENQQGRGAPQVLANLSVAAACSVGYALTGKFVFVLGLIGALAEAAADTVSSELGQTKGESARLITTWQAVPAGTSGGISGIGTACGVTAAALVSLLPAWLGLLPGKWWAAAALAGTFGMVCDSFLGATLEKKGLLDNNGVNFLSTFLAAVAAIILGSILASY